MLLLILHSIYLLIIKYQQKLLSDYMNGVRGDNYKLKDNTESSISANYNGIMAAKILGTTYRNSAVYKVKDGKAVGSFRGKYSKVDYCSYFRNYCDGNFAEGHNSAFGFEVPVGMIDDIMSGLDSLESNMDKREYITAGLMPLDKRGRYHIDDMESFKKQHLLLQLAVANSKLSKEEEIRIIVQNNSYVERIPDVSDTSKVIKYDVLGLKCKAFEELRADYIEVYAEYSTCIELYAKNKWY